MRLTGLAGALALSTACGAEAPAAPPVPDIQTREVTYTHDGTTLTGFFAWNAAETSPRPGVLVVHEWWGHDQHARNQARRLAEAGYVGFALDVYGDGKLAEHPAEAQQFMEEATRDPAVLGARFNAAREILAEDTHVDPDRTAAIGYCFGGSVVLNMARSGADLDAVVSFHGALGAAAPAQPGQVTARLLVLTGEADSMVPPDAVEAFRQEMTAAGAVFRIVSYPGARHAFTNPNAGTHGMPELAYDKAADERSWQEMLNLFRQVFP